MTAETLIIHGGDLVSWHVASGFIGKPLQRIAPEKLKIEISKAPKALRVYHKANGTVLWHQHAAGPSSVVPGKATVTDLIAQPTATYAIEGSVSDPTGHYLPRTFAFTLGNTREHAIALYLSPQGARFSPAGGIYGRVAYEDETAAIWALVTLTVTPSLGPALVFTAQTDAHGEFRLPLDRLPALTRDAPSPSYSARLEVKASASANAEKPLNPETLTAAQVADGKDGNDESQFADFFTLAITPGKTVAVASPEHSQIVLKST